MDLFSTTSKSDHIKGRNLNTSQIAVIKIVENYKLLFPQEYNAVVQYLKERRKDLKTKFAEVIDTKGGLKSFEILERAIHEVPVTLEKMFSLSLTTEELLWLRTKQGARWFAREYKEFLSGDKD